MRAPSLIWAGTEYDQFAGAVVYGWRRRKEWLYLGCSQYGVSRLCNHNIIGRRLRVRASDEFPTWICQTMDEAMLLEHELLTTYRPRWGGGRWQARNPRIRLPA